MGQLRVFKLILFMMGVFVLSACARNSSGFAPTPTATPPAPVADGAPGDKSGSKTISPSPANPSANQPGQQAPNNSPTDENEIVVIGHRPKPPAAPPTPAPAPKPPAHVITQAQLPVLPIPAWVKRPQGETWSKITVKAIADLGQDLLATNLADAGEFCPKYNQLAKVDRAKVWLTMIAAMSLFESSFLPLSFYRERFKNSKNQYVISRGLLQISSESANDYGCGITKESDLEDPEKNIRCGVRILSRLVATDHRLHGSIANSNNNQNSTRWFGAARYWHVLRGNRKDATIRQNTRSLPQC